MSYIPKKYKKRTRPSMIDNNKKIAKLKSTFDFCPEKISPIDLQYDDDKVWNLIDKIIKINDYIEKLKSTTPDQEKKN
jgi:hypothetical protein